MKKNLAVIAVVVGSGLLNVAQAASTWTVTFNDAEGNVIGSGYFQANTYEKTSILTSDNTDCYRGCEGIKYEYLVVNSQVTNYDFTIDSANAGLQRYNTENADPSGGVNVSDFWWQGKSAEYYEGTPGVNVDYSQFSYPQTLTDDLAPGALYDSESDGIFTKKLDWWWLVNSETSGNNAYGYPVKTYTSLVMGDFLQNNGNEWSGEWYTVLDKYVYWNSNEYKYSESVPYDSSSSMGTWTAAYYGENLPSAVPLPASLPLFISAIAGLGLFSRKRKNNP